MDLEMKAHGRALSVGKKREEREVGLGVENGGGQQEWDSHLPP